MIYRNKSINQTTYDILKIVDDEIKHIKFPSIYPKLIYPIMYYNEDYIIKYCLQQSNLILLIIKFVAIL